MNTPTFIVLAMSTPVIILLVVVAVFIAALVGLYFYAKKMERKQVEAQEQMKAVAQSVSMLIIDKRRMKLKDAGLPSVVLENAPKYLSIRIPRLSQYPREFLSETTSSPLYRFSHQPLQSQASPL